MLWFLLAQTLRDCYWTKHDEIDSNMSKETLDHALKIRHKSFCLSIYIYQALTELWVKSEAWHKGVWLKFLMYSKNQLYIELFEI